MNTIANGLTQESAYPLKRGRGDPYLSAAVCFGTF
jgi:hypothetical protein